MVWQSKENQQLISCSWLPFFSTKCFLISSSSSSSSSKRLAPEKTDAVSRDSKKKPGGWKSMPFVLGNETFERLATIGLLANFMMFLLTVFHMEQVSASNILNIWSGITNFAPLLGAFISDAYVGRFLTIAFSSFASLLGMITLTLIAWMPQLHPPPCTPQQSHLNQCKGPTKSQLGVLVMALGLLSVGTGGIRPCSIPFGVDQFDAGTEDGRKGINSFFNWYYTTFTVVLIIALTLVVYVQDSVSWVWGFGIPTMLMLCSIILFFVGTRLYVHVKPEGSVFSGIAEVLVAAYKKRNLKLPPDAEAGGVVSFYDAPTSKATFDPKHPLTSQFRLLNKAAVIEAGDLKSDGSRLNRWRLCSIQQVEEAKCLAKVAPVWASGIVCFTAMAQQATFTTSQALKMDRHLGPHFQIPPGSLMTISMVTVGLWVPFYDRIFVPHLSKITKIDSGISLLQRMGIGIIFSILSMVAAGLIEQKRRENAILHGTEIAPMTVMWLAPQLILMGFAEAFNIIGQIEFYYKEFPENMRSVANSLFFVTAAGANYLSSLVVSVIHNFTAKDGRPDWLTKNINDGKVDYFYYLLAGMGFLNYIYFLFVSRRYHYKSRVEIINGKEEEPHVDVELNDMIKH